MTLALHHVERDATLDPHRTQAIAGLVSSLLTIHNFDTDENDDDSVRENKFVHGIADDYILI